jgi:ubiquinol-cytochrome c reductase cytochrome b subunit
VITRRLFRWFDERLGAASFARSALNKVFPDNWTFMFGEIAMYCFVILVLTGVYLTFFFVPSAKETIYAGSYAPFRGTPVSEAYSSTLRISFDVRAGLVMRQMHHWAANVFLAAIVVHLMRIFFTGAFRKPREINWIVGMTLFLLALFNGFTGYSLPDDLLSGTGLRIAYSIFLSIPFVGTWLAFLVFGGEFPSHDILSRLFVLHVMIVPGLIIALLSLHLALIWHQKHTQFPSVGRTETNVVGSRLWPSYTMRSVGLLFAIAAVLGVLGGLAQINPVWLYGPFNASAVTSPAQPDWYLGWLEGALRIFPSWEVRAFGHTISNPFFPGVLLPGITFMVLYAWPFLEAAVTKDRTPHSLLDRPRDRPVRTAVGGAALAFFGILFLAGSNDVMARIFDVPVSSVTRTFQILVLVLPVVTGGLVYRLTKAYRRSGAESFLEVPREAILGRPRAEHPVPGRPGEAVVTGPPPPPEAETVEPSPEGVR